VTYYEILQVAPSASPEVIEASWKALLRKYHPDNQKTGSKAKAVALNQAHDVLSDPVKRKEYDRERFGWAAGFEADQPRNGHAKRRKPSGKSPGGAYEPAYGQAYETPVPAPLRDPNRLMQEFIQDVARTGELAVGSFFDAASELMLAKLAEASPALAALMREQLERNRR